MIKLNYNIEKVLDIRQIEDNDKAFHGFAKSLPVELQNLYNALKPQVSKIKPR